MTTPLHQRHCRALSKDEPALDQTAAGALLSNLHSDWHINWDTAQLQREFKFRDFYQTIAFVNALAWIANQQDHHPDLEVSYNRCHVHFTTHSVGGLSENDFICAARIDALTADAE